MKTLNKNNYIYQCATGNHKTLPITPQVTKAKKIHYTKQTRYLLGDCKNEHGVVIVNDVSTRTVRVEDVDRRKDTDLVLST